MKFIVIFYLLSIVTFYVSNAMSMSYNRQQARLYDLLRKPLGEKFNSIALSRRNDKDRSASFLNQQSSSIEDEDFLQTRNNWDSGEDYYFQWASQNRRPIEYLTGRKREVEKVILPTRDRRINGGLWRSGLVG